MKFPKLGSIDVIIPGMANLSLNIKLSSTAHPNRMLVINIGRAIVKKLVVKFDRNEILGVDDFDVFVCLPMHMETSLSFLLTLKC